VPQHRPQLIRVLIAQIDLIGGVVQTEADGFHRLALPIEVINHRHFRLLHHLLGPGVWLYGAPYLALALMPSSSVAAVATKSAGADRLQDVNVTCGSSGEENNAASAAVSSPTTTSATTNAPRLGGARSGSSRSPRQRMPAACRRR